MNHKKLTLAILEYMYSFTILKNKAKLHIDMTGLACLTQNNPRIYCFDSC